MRGSTLPFALMKTYGPVFVNLKEKRNPLICFVPLSLSCSFLFFLSSFLFFFSFTYSPELFFLVCSFPFLFSFHFLFSLFLFLFSIFFLPFLISISHLGLQHPNGPKVGETSPHFPLLPLVITTIFRLIFLIFLFPLFPFFDTWLNVSHSHKCTTWIMTCVTPLGFHVAST